MNTASCRAYALSNCVIAAFAVALLCNYLTGLYQLNPKKITGGVQHVETHELSRVGNQVKHICVELSEIQSDRALLEMHLKYDLTGVFDWSTHMIFLYVTASYKSGRHVRNEIIIHNKIIKSRLEAFDPGSNKIAMYYLNDFSRALRNKNVTLTLYCHIYPLAGPLHTVKLAESKFTMPANYLMPNGTK
ncbi:Signal peptidase complex subunit 3 [Babesia duncani]|uniref:Signal peptidase complex subunit 3 n=1 Tax=Babesia duncani TaxID=323732 RepID=A0AAD9PM35_9APIC|nr:Signal peptidase complex subunit 3 [Babesia duncani]KAK2196937.1 Signal peptidase complex subunit 3 [Babesia duncani]